MTNRKILRREIYKLSIKTISPINVSGGELNSDADVLRNSQGEAFVPGTSIAGIIRSYFEAKKSESCYFGYAKDSEGSMSSIIISDMIFNDAVISLKDRVELDNTKQVNNKFDMEMVEPGATGEMKFEFVCRDGDLLNADEIMNRCIQAFDNGDLRIGGLKNRGFGRIKIEEVRHKVFNETNVDEYLNDDFSNEEVLSFTEYIESHNKLEMKYDKIVVPLKLKGGIIIREYSAQPGEADFEHVKVGDTPIIPGTSWNGAIRKQATETLNNLIQMNKGSNLDAEKFIKEWFGFVEVKKDNEKTSDEKQDSKEAASSKIVVPKRLSRRCRTSSARS